MHNAWSGIQEVDDLLLLRNPEFLPRLVVYAFVFDSRFKLATVASINLVPWTRVQWCLLWHRDKMVIACCCWSWSAANNCYKNHAPNDYSTSMVQYCTLWCTDSLILLHCATLEYYCCMMTHNAPHWKQITIKMNSGSLSFIVLFISYYLV